MMDDAMTGADTRVAVFAPARVDLSPGFPDVEPFCTLLSATIVNVAIDLGVGVTVTRDSSAAERDSFVGRLTSTIATRLGISSPRLLIASRGLPRGSGLGTSGALSVAIAYALSLCTGAPVDDTNVVTLACDAERAAGVTAGTQDQLASAQGGVGVVNRHRGIGSRSKIGTDIEALGSRITLVHGGGTRNSGSIIESVLRDTPHSSAVAIVREMNAVGRATDHALACNDFSTLANCIEESTILLSRLHPDIVARTMLGKLSEVGPVAAKPCGAGGVGAAWVVLTAPQDRMAFQAEVRSGGLRVLPATLSLHGMHQITDVVNLR